MRARPVSRQAGVTLIDTVVASALLLFVFVGIAAAFKLSVDIVTNNKARAGAVALADERMEYVRSLAYSAVGTVGGVPAGLIPQSETVLLNGVTYTRRTYIEYEDDPKDGTGSSDSNGVTEDYKAVKVDVAWATRLGTRHITVVTRVSPQNGLETSVPGGTLIINAINAAGSPLLGASVSISNLSTSPTININTYTDASGTAMVLGAPNASGYHVVVTEAGYSTAQTYNATSQNTSPNPGNLTVSNNQTTSGTFAIDVLGTKIIRTWTQILNGSWSDACADMSKVATSTNVTVSSGTAALSSGPSWGEVQSVQIAPSNLSNWQTLTTVGSQPAGTSILYRVYDGAGLNLIPDAQLPGNAAGFTGGAIPLANVSTTTYPSIRLDAVMTTSTSSTPSLDSWSVAYAYGPTPLPNIAFNLQGAKTIGSGPSGTIYKYSANLSTDASGSITVPNLEWDNYTVSVNGSATGYDVASACNPQPESLAPGATMTSDFYLTAHTANSLLVDVRASASGALIQNAYVTLTKGSFIATSTTDSCGQSFFPNLASANNYSASASSVGHATTTISVNVSGAARASISLN